MTRSTARDAAIRDQFARQAAVFAAAPALHNDAIHTLMIEAARPQLSDGLLDVACGPGTVVAAFALLVAQAIGVDDDRLGMPARRAPNGVVIAYSAVVLCAVKRPRC